MNSPSQGRLKSIAVAMLFTATTQAATITRQVTHQWATNYLEYVPTIALPGIPAFNPALGTLTRVSYSLGGERRTEWAAIAGGDGGGYTLGAYSQFLLNAPELSGLPTRTLALFTTPQQWATGWLPGGESTGGTLVSASSSNGIVTTELDRFTQTNQYFLLSNYGSDGGAVGYGGGAGFSSIVRFASATVTITYEYDPAPTPKLSIVSAGVGEATLSWTPNEPGWILQETLSLSPTNWVNALSGPTNPITVPANLPTRFYRLLRP